MIDIIIPCYNSHSTIEKTLNSIVIQSIKNKIQVLLVDDNSRNDYQDIIQTYKDYINISLISLEKNSGSGIAREKGIEKTNGKYIMFLDSDDILLGIDSIKKLYDKIVEGYDVVISQEYDQRKNLFLIQNGNLHGKIYRRSYLENNSIHFNQSRFHEDNFFHNYVRLSGAKIALLPSPTYFYSYNRNSITQKKYDFKNDMDIYLSNIKELLLIADSKNYDRELINNYRKEKEKYLKEVYNGVEEAAKEQLLELIQIHDLNFILDK